MMMMWKLSEAMMMMTVMETLKMKMMVQDAIWYGGDHCTLSTYFLMCIYLQSESADNCNIGAAV